MEKPRTATVTQKSLNATKGHLLHQEEIIAPAESEFATIDAYGLRRQSAAIRVMPWVWEGVNPKEAALRN